MSAQILSGGFGLPDFGYGSSPVLNGEGGAFGFAPDYSQFLGFQPHVKEHGWCILARPPSFVKYLPNSNYYLTILREFFERRPKEWSGLQYGLSNTFAETPVGGQNKAYHITNVERSESSPSISVNDIKGRPFQKMLETWSMAMMDPITKVPGLVTLSAYDGAAIDANMFTVDLIFFEPTPEFRDIEQACIFRGGMPETTGDGEIKMNKTSEKESLELQITFKGFADFSAGAKSVARTLLQAATFTGANFAAAPASVSGISSTLSGIPGGIFDNLQNLASTSIRG
ncbi:MAG: hypothetical protein ACKO0Z_27965 [Betaproteobacteria bacterium]